MLILNNNKYSVEGLFFKFSTQNSRLPAVQKQNISCGNVQYFSDDEARSLS